MIDQINYVREKGFKPIIYIDDILIKNNEIYNIIRLAKKLSVYVCYEFNVSNLNKIHKAYVFRYGVIPRDTEVMIKRKGGVIVSGNLVIK